MVSLRRGGMEGMTTHSGARQDRIVVHRGEGCRAQVTYQTRESCQTGENYQSRENGVWRMKRISEGWLGRGGVGKTKEGDGKTPSGRLSFLYAFGTCPSPGTVFPYRRLDDSHELVDDAGSQYYNQIVSRRDVVPDWRSAEHMAAMGRAYRYGLVTDYNRDRIPGLGSGIFLHCEEGRPTAGCVAVPQEMMCWLLKNMSADCYMVIDFPGG